jgi:hypothetical protein
MMRALLRSPPGSTFFFGSWLFDWGIRHLQSIWQEQGVPVERIDIGGQSHSQSESLPGVQTQSIAI